MTRAKIYSTNSNLFNTEYPWQNKKNGQSMH